MRTTLRNLSGWLFAVVIAVACGIAAVSAPAQDDASANDSAGPSLDTNWSDCAACHPQPDADLPPLAVFRTSATTFSSALCSDCHDAMELTALRNNWVHPVRSVAAHLPCTQCHLALPHSAERPLPLPTGDYHEEGCYECHPDVQMQRSMASSHGSRPGLSCRRCHPAHEPLPAALPADQLPSDIREQWQSSYDWWLSNDSCLDCHMPVELITPLDRGFVTLNTVNYHEVHTLRGQALCVECHDPHGSLRRGMIRERLLSGQLLSFEDSFDGGNCTVQCHGVDHQRWTYVNRAD